MSLLNRKPRPLKRDAEFLRDDRLVIVGCDDTYAPKQYFDAFRLRGVQVHVAETQDGQSSAQHVLNRILEVEVDEDDERWMILDTDHCLKDQHFEGFIKAITDARQRGVQVALSRPCFELWLLLHHLAPDDVKEIADATEGERRLRDVLGSYNKTKLDMTKFPVQSVPSACRGAEELDAAVKAKDRPESNTSQVYRLWKSIIAKASPNQLPKALWPLHEELARRES